MTELEQAARVAWAAVTKPTTGFTAMVERIAGEFREPMEPAIALDFVQNVTGERDDAVTALMGAAADWLAERKPPTVGGEIDTGNREDADRVTAYLRGEFCALAKAYLLAVEERRELAAHPLATHADRIAATLWRAWSERARHALALCVAIAYPGGEKPETPA